ncbi:MAG: efflux RND transporter periplasmic adaptor subunit [Firmicutes bacterium]|nr:efflux RND transporter periplasmic adaptor subunit [Bacillota bacterium]
MKLSNKKRRIIAILVIIGVLGAGWFARKQRLDKAATGSRLHREITPEMVMRVEKGDLQKTISASGYLSPQQIKELYFSISGRVKNDYLDAGKRVKKGEVLVELEKTRQELEYIRAKKAYDLAVINGSEREIKEAELTLRLAKENLEATTLTAPFDGIITRDLVDVGDYVGINEQNAVGTIMADGPYEIDVEISESECHLVKIGQEVRITVEAVPERTFLGRVKEIALQAKNNNGIVTLPVKIILNEETELLKPEFSADLEIIVEEVKDQVLVPVAAIINNRGQEQVIKVVNNRPVPTPVKTGLNNGFSVVILEGVEPGDEILINAHPFANNAGTGSSPGARPGPGSRPGIMIRGR